MSENRTGDPLQDFIIDLAKVQDKEHRGKFMVEFKLI